MEEMIKYYENYDEENRMSRGRAQNLEFITTTSIMDNIILSNSTILEVGAGTGRYSFYYAAKKHQVTAVEIVPKYVQFMKEKLDKNEEELELNIERGDARDLSRFSDESFDVVLCLGPLYHLTESEDRTRCIKECIRVLKKGGILAVAYVNKFFIIPYLAQQDKKYLNEEYVSKIIEKGYITSKDDDCFWTDAYFYSPDELEKMMSQYNVSKLENIGTDGVSILLRDMVNSMDDEQYKVWVNYHLKTCREQSTLGYSNHGLYICKKN